jgi:thiamine kinase-like enzyme
VAFVSGHDAPIDPSPGTEREPPGRSVPRILVRLAEQLGAIDDEPTVLQGGMTNRNLRVSFAGRPAVVRLCGKQTAALGIDRVTEELATRQAAAIGVAPDVLLRLADEDVLVCAHLPGHPVSSATLREPDRLARLAGALRRFHETPALPTAFDVVRLCEEQADRAGDRAAPFVPALVLAHRIAAALDGHPEHAPVPCHNDLLAANVIEDDDGDMRLIDWEYAGMNDRFFDLANLAANNGLTDADQAVLLDAYFARPGEGGATRRRRAALSLMLVVSDLREALWGVTQETLSELDVDYDAYAAEHLDRLRTRLAHPDIERWISLAQTA